MQDYLIDRFGEYPDEVAHLLVVGEIKMNGDRALIETIRKHGPIIQFVLSKAGTKAYSVEQLFEALAATKLKATLGVEKEQMQIKLTVPKNMAAMVWLHEVQSFVKALREERYQNQLQQKNG